MKTLYRNSKNFIHYFFKFLLIFSFIYYGTIALIGIVSPGGYYSKFVATWLDYVSLLRYVLLQSSMAILHVLGYQVYLKDAYSITLQNGHGVHVGFDCIGYGVMAFWLAFVLANNGSKMKKLQWISIGLFSIFIINVVRISMMLIAVNKHWKSPLGLDNHTLFNIVAYALIFFMIYLFDRTAKNKADKNFQKS